MSSAAVVIGALRVNTGWTKQFYLSLSFAMGLNGDVFTTFFLVTEDIYYKINKQCQSETKTF